MPRFRPNDDKGSLSRFDTPIRIKWLVNVKGWVDEFPAGAFASHQDGREASHCVFNPHDQPDGRAHYRLSLAGRRARLDYSACARQNEREGMELGVLTLIFADSSRARVLDVWWQEHVDGVVQKGVAQQITGPSGQSAVRASLAALELYELGQGRQTDPRAREAVERYAMRRAQRHYERENWQVENVSQRESFDLYCKRDATTLRVEVKGTIGSARSIVVTGRELELAKQHYPNVALYVVHAIGLKRNAAGNFRAYAGEVRLIEPWDPDGGDREVVTVRWYLPEL